MRHSPTLYVMQILPLLQVQDPSMSDSELEGLLKGATRADWFHPSNEEGTEKTLHPSDEEGTEKTLLPLG